jgi:hypothetical protein
MVHGSPSYRLDETVTLDTEYQRCLSSGQVLVDLAAYSLDSRVGSVFVQRIQLLRLLLEREGGEIVRGDAGWIAINDQTGNTGPPGAEVIGRLDDYNAVVLWVESEPFTGSPPNLLSFPPSSTSMTFPTPACMAFCTVSGSRMAHTAACCTLFLISSRRR